MKYTKLKDSFNGYFFNVIKEQYSDFDGRTSREDYWMFLLWYWVIAIALSLISFGMLGLAMVVLCCIPAAAINIRRFHDIDYSGWYYLGLLIASMIPFVGFFASIFWIYLMCQKGSPDVNSYGKNTE
tara:strand:- start:323 stop:703 length:381 start_codon:yes stop_codon:yes gene_type:complete